jgi:anti-anti-sigma regulatory factor
MSTAAIQVLAAFVLERRACGRDIRFEAPSENFVSAFEILGLKGIIEDRVTS